jgi:transcription termination/antitermination protein NusA
MSTSIAQNIETLCKEQGIDRDLVITAVKEAVRAAARKQFKTNEDIQVEWNPEAGIELFTSKVIVEKVTNPSSELSLDEARELAGDEVEIGDELQLPLPMEEMGRIAAQTAKQILFQKVRDAVRSNIYDQYVDKIGDLVNGFIKRFERGNIIVDLGNIEAILPRTQQSRAEQWNQGDRVRVVINSVSKDAKGPQVEVSRTSPELLRRLFEMEVPEIYDGTVIIKSAVREPGERAKIAVVSNERDVDPVGACVGMKGSRVQAIIRELRGEKIDIIEWSDEPSVFAANALSPAKVNQVRITDIENRQMEVIVNEDQLSLAIGKRGQNVRLATRLVGWNIDIRSEEEIKREVSEQMGAVIASGGPVPLTAIPGITAASTAILADRGIDDIDGLANVSIDDLTEFLDMSMDEAEKILDAANAIIAARNASKYADENGEQHIEQHAASEELDPNVPAREVEPSDEMIAAGYDEAVRDGIPYHAEPDIRAELSSDPVAITEADPMTADELRLQGAGHDLAPDTITPSPDITSSGVAVIEATGAYVEEDRMEEEEDDSPISPIGDFASEESAPEAVGSEAATSDNPE